MRLRCGTLIKSTLELPLFGGPESGLHSSGSACQRFKHRAVEIPRALLSGSEAMWLSGSKGSGTSQTRQLLRVKNMIQLADGAPCVGSPK